MTTYYPTTAMFRDLTPEQRWERQDVNRELLEQVQYWRGDPLLNWWQVGFLANLEMQLRGTRFMCRISEAQWAKIREIQALMETEGEAPWSSDEDEELTC